MFVLDVARHGVLADHERRGDLAVALSGRDESQHLELATRQPPATSVSCLWPDRLDPGNVGRRAESVEDSAGAVELEGGSVVVPELSTCEGDENAGTRTLVRCTASCQSGLHA